MSPVISPLEQSCINTIRFLSIDAIQKAKSGHPGITMGAAPMTFVLWNRHLRFNPKNPKWFNRDRFILSAGHGSMLQYALLHLTGYDSVSINDIKNFRQWGSTTPGHPENQVTPGVEVTTGPLGQGIGNAIGMALAERFLASKFNRPGCELVDHYTYTLVGDGCMMSGMASESCSLAGHLGLGKLIALYDDNRISIDGSTALTFTEDSDKRFEAYGWHVQVVEDGDTDINAIAEAIEKAKSVTDKPSMIRIHTTIGYGSPGKANSADSHGAPLGVDEVQATRENMGWKEPPFSVPEDVLDHMRKAIDKGAELEADWNETLAKYKKQYPEDAATFQQLTSRELPEGWEELLPTFQPDDKPDATRSYSGRCINLLADTLIGMIGGSADLSDSNKVVIKNSGAIQKNAYGNRNIHYGVREHGMGAICNGMALHNSGIIPYCGTFLAFSDYMRGAVRMAAVSGAGVIFIMSHDSVAVGEDGPTHQPIEQIAALRAIPNLVVIRPADGNETSGAYKVAIKNRQRPSLLALTRQKVPHVQGTSADNVCKGAYVLSDCSGTPDIILIGTGSELFLCSHAAKVLSKDGVKVRVVSMPSYRLFSEQDKAYRESVLPLSVRKRLAVEAGSSLGWQRHVGFDGATISIDKCGTSAPGDVCLEKAGFTVKNVITQARKLLG